MVFALQRRFRGHVVVRAMRGEWGEERRSFYTLHAWCDVGGKYVFTACIC